MGLETQRVKNQHNIIRHKKLCLPMFECLPCSKDLVLNEKLEMVSPQEELLVLWSHTASRYSLHGELRRPP